MAIINRFEYQTLEKVTQSSGARHYVCPVSGNKLPSVTTVLDKTAPEKKELLEWRKRVGDEKADQIKKEALSLGTLMHLHLENHLMDIPRPGGNNTARIMAEKMADQIIQRGLINVDEVYGSEVHLYCPEMVAGTCDLIGLWKGQMAILDFKTAKKMRTRSMIHDYLLQVGAYALCHDFLYETDIKTAVIFMVDRDYNFQEFVVEGDEFVKSKLEFLDRLEAFIAA